LLRSGLEEDERLNELKRYLSSTLREFQSLIESAGNFDDTRVGNGWDPSHILESLVVLPSISPERLLEKLSSSGLSTLSRIIWRLKGRPPPRIAVLSSTRVYTPVWIVEGFHECYYFRATSYRIPTKEDVVAVEVEGTLRNLIVQDSEPKTLLSALKIGIDRIAGLITSAPRYFVLDGVLELARSYREARLCFDRFGRPSCKLKRLIKSKSSFRRIRDHEELKQHIGGSETKSLEVSKDKVINALHRRIVIPPVSFTRILTNRFEVTNVTLIHLPTFRIEYTYDDETRKVEVDGFSGDPVEE
jgi:hypothetical protein